MPSWLVSIAVGLAFAIALIVLVAQRRRVLRSRAAQARARRAVQGERRAAALLEAAGFVIEGAQVPARYALAVDGRERWFDVRADYLVARGRSRWVAEVKTGELAPRLELPATRRQLLEYGLAFEADGVLLVDVEAARIHEIALPWRAPATTTHRSFGLALVFFGCAAIGTLVAFLR